MIDSNLENKIMNRSSQILICAAMLAVLSGCTPPPHRDIPVLTSEIDAVIAGHYGQSIYHEEMAQEALEDAHEVLMHWQNDHYWNIEEGQMAVDAARAAAVHRFESEKALCQWLTVVHNAGHNASSVAQRTAAYFNTGSAEPYQTNLSDIATLGAFLHAHPDAKANVTAYTDTVGSDENNKILAEKRAANISRLLVQHGARADQLHVVSVGEADGPDNTADQNHRAVTISTQHLVPLDCAGLK